MHSMMLLQAEVMKTEDIFFASTSQAEIKEQKFQFHILIDGFFTNELS